MESESSSFLLISISSLFALINPIGITPIVLSLTENLNIKECNSCDYIFCIYEGGFNFIYYGDKGFKHYMNTLKKTKAKVYPSVKMQEFILYMILQNEELRL